MVAARVSEEERREEGVRAGRVRREEEASASSEEVGSEEVNLGWRLLSPTEQPWPRGQMENENGYEESEVSEARQAQQVPQEGSPGGQLGRGSARARPEADLPQEERADQALRPVVPPE